MLLIHLVKYKIISRLLLSLLPPSIANSKLFLFKMALCAIADFLHRYLYNIYVAVTCTDGHIKMLLMILQVPYSHFLLADGQC